MGPSNDLKVKITNSLACISIAISQFGPDGCALSFNGGKDCTVLLDLLCKCGHLPASGRWPVCYVAHTDSFTELDAFVADCTHRYPINVHRIVGDMKDSVAAFLHSNQQVKAIFIGVRRTDPFCGQLHELDATDNGWPNFMRCHPILDWTYANVWEYLIGRKVSYCSLYDAGYTSLGSSSTTMPNPHLKTSDGSYKPAYLLVDEAQERAGRIRKGVGAVA